MDLQKILDEHKKWVKDESQGGKANLSGADLSYANLRGANLSYADLSYADLSYADLSYADLSYADLGYADLGYADLSYADLGGADLSGADLSGAKGIISISFDKRGYILYLYHHIELQFMAGRHTFDYQEALDHWGNDSYPDKQRGNQYVKAVKFLKSLWEESEE